MRMRAADMAGWLGVAAILVAYGLVSFDAIESDAAAYQVLNFAGAAGVALVSFVKRAYPPTVLNTVWSVIAVVALIRILA
jgi:adenosine/AMP kinase